jgi:chromosome segregation ATPase
MAEKQLHIESLQKSSAEMTAQLTLARQAVESAKDTTDALTGQIETLNDQLADFMEGNDTLNETITKLTETLSKKDLEISDLNGKLKEGLKGYSKLQLLIALFFGK